MSDADSDKDAQDSTLGADEEEDQTSQFHEEDMAFNSDDEGRGETWDHMPHYDSLTDSESKKSWSWGGRYEKGEKDADEDSGHLVQDLDEARVPESDNEDDPEDEDDADDDDPLGDLEDLGRMHDQESEETEIAQDQGGRSHEAPTPESEVLQGHTEQTEDSKDAQVDAEQSQMYQDGDDSEGQTDVLAASERPETQQNRDIIPSESQQDDSDQDKGDDTQSETTPAHRHMRSPRSRRKKHTWDENLETMTHPDGTKYAVQASGIPLLK